MFSVSLTVSDLLERDGGAGVYCDRGIVLHLEVQLRGGGACPGNQGGRHGGWNRRRF